MTMSDPIADMLTRIRNACFRELAYKGQIPGVKKASW